MKKQELTNPPYSDGEFYNGEKEEKYDMIDILNGSSQESLFTHVADAAHAGKAQAMAFSSASAHRMFLPAGLFAMHCRRISLKILSAMLLSRNLLRRFWLMAVASGAFSMSPSPQDH